MTIVGEKGFASVAFPIIGAGSGGFDQERALEFMLDELEGLKGAADVTIVRYQKNR